VIERLPANHLAGWLLAAFASIVAGAAGLHAVFLFALASPGYEPQWAKIGGYVLLVVAALIVGRRAKPKTPPSRPAESPARRRFEENAVPIAVTAVAVALSGVLFPLAYFFWLVGWEAGNAAHANFLAFGLASVGPVLIAGAWVLRR
jgi:hypothetical protein